MASTPKGQRAGGSSPKERKRDRQEAIERRRQELLERIRHVDPSALKALTLSLSPDGVPAVDGPPAADESFHKYFFKGAHGFTEAWRNVAEVVTVTE